MRRWWCKKYGRPPTDPAYQAATPSALAQELFEDLWVTRDELEKELCDGKGTNEQRERLASVCRALGESPPVFDALADKWDEDIRAGRTPDLTEGWKYHG